MPDKQQIVLTDEQINAFEDEMRQEFVMSHPGLMLNLSMLCQTVRALREERSRLAEASGEWARLLDRIRAWSKCKDGYPLDEHINNIVVEHERLKNSRRVHELDNHHNALACGYCSGPLRDELTRLQSQLEQLRAENEKLKGWVDDFEKREGDVCPIEEGIGFDRYIRSLKSELAQVRQELTEEKRLRAELKRIAQIGISEVSSVGTVLKDNALIDFRSRAVQLCKDKAAEWEQEAKVMAISDENHSTPAIKARAAIELARELEKL